MQYLYIEILTTYTLKCTLSADWGGAKMKNIEDEVIDLAIEEDEMYVDDEDLVDNDDMDAWIAAFNKGYKAA